jgi:DNA recombination protein RmuC
MEAVWLLAGLAIGGFSVWLLMRANSDTLSDRFAALSADALRANNASFLELARETFERERAGADAALRSRTEDVERLVEPVRESLDKFADQVRCLELARTEAYTSLREQVRGLSDAQERLQRETGVLARALRSSNARGRWGELQLRRVVEAAGMVAHCDFTEQVRVGTATGTLTPDVVVHLPGDRNVVVDAKAPLQAFLEAAEIDVASHADDDRRDALLAEHARQTRAHALRLAEKSYWQQFERSPDFVVMFLPGEAFLSAALEQQPGLIEEVASRNVVLATPTTLIALLRTIAGGWREEAIAEHAERVAALGAQLHDRLCTMVGHMEKLRRGLCGAVEAYNQAVGSFEGRVLVAARRFTELGVTTSADLIETGPLDITPRVLRAVDATDLPESPPPKHAAV